MENNKKIGNRYIPDKKPAGVNIKSLIIDAADMGGSTAGAAGIIDGSIADAGMENSIAGACVDLF